MNALSPNHWTAREFLTCPCFSKKDAVIFLKVTVSQLNTLWEKPNHVPNSEKTEDQQLRSHHLISSSDENGDGSGVLALLDDQHLVFGGPE